MYCTSNNTMDNPVNMLLRSSIGENAFGADTICSFMVLHYSSICTAMLGLSGMIFGLYDMWMIMTSRPILRRPWMEDIISEEAKRDCKLIMYWFSTLIYLFLLLGIATNIPAFFLPFLVVYSIIIFFECNVFILRAIFVRKLDLQFGSTIMSISMVFNWACVVCTFLQSLSHCN